MINFDTLKFAPSTVDGVVNIHITEGEYAGVVFNFGRTWFPDENEPVLSFEYDVSSDTKPANVPQFQQDIGVLLHVMLKRALAEENLVYGGGVDEKPTIVEEPPSDIMKPWDYKLPEPAPGTTMSRNLFQGFK